MSGKALAAGSEKDRRLAPCRSCHLLPTFEPSRISFFLRGVAEQSRDAVRRSEKLLGIWQRYRQQFQVHM